MKKTYILVFVLLTFLTIVEIGIAEYTHGIFKQGSLTCIALLKAFYVAYYFMHLKDESPLLKAIALLPLFGFIFAVVLIVEVSIR
jgi:cytochrome c oxidase subunit 4